MADVEVAGHPSARSRPAAGWRPRRRQTELARLSETIARLYGDAKGMIHAIAMDPRLEQADRKSVV